MGFGAIQWYPKVIVATDGPEIPSPGLVAGRVMGANDPLGIETKSMTRYTQSDASDLTHAWTEATRHWTKSVLEAQRGALASLGVIEDIEREDTKGTAYSGSDWTFERSVETPAEISVGDTVRFTKRLDDEDVRSFAATSGDTNRLHLEDEFAADTRFGGRIVHGTLVAGLISAALARIPGLTIYLSQDLRFLAPVEIGSLLTAETEVLEDLGDSKFRLRTDVMKAESGETVIEGEAVVLIDDLPEERSSTAEE